MLATCSCVTTFCLHALDVESHIELRHSDDAFFREHLEFMAGLRTVNAMNERCAAVKNRVRIFIPKCESADVACNSTLPWSQIRQGRHGWRCAVVQNKHSSLRVSTSPRKIMQRIHNIHLGLAFQHIPMRNFRHLNEWLGSLFRSSRRLWLSCDFLAFEGVTRLERQTCDCICDCIESIVASRCVRTRFSRER